MTDGDQDGTTRRRFLGAAAAVAGLTGLSTTTTAEQADATAIIEEQTVADDGSYVTTDCGSVPGELSNVTITQAMCDGEIDVQATFEKDGWNVVGLDWQTKAFSFHTALDPDAARDLASRLVVAADQAEGNHAD